MIIPVLAKMASKKQQRIPTESVPLDAAPLARPIA
jgi:hypothetical protein